MTLEGTQILWRGQTWGHNSGGVRFLDWGKLLDFDTDAATLGTGPGDGGEPGPLWVPGHTWTLRLEVQGEGVDDAAKATDLHTKLAALKAVTGCTTDRTGEYDFRWHIDGQTDDRLRRARIVGRRITLNVDSLGTRVVPVELDFLASDPTIYGVTVHDLDTPLARGDSATVTNSGDHAPLRGHLLPVASIAGPIVNPQLVDQHGNGIKYHGTVADGDTLTLDWSTRRALIGFTSVYPDCTDPTGGHLPGFFPLPPGDTTITYSGDSGAGTCGFTWRDTEL